MHRQPARLKGCAEGWPAKLLQGKVKVCLGALGVAAALCIPGQRRGPRPGRRLSSHYQARGRANQDGRHAVPGPSCPYDRAGRRGALPFFGKLQPWRAGPGPGWGRSYAASSRRLGAAPWSIQPLLASCPGFPTLGSGFLTTSMLGLRPAVISIAAPGVAALCEVKGRLLIPLRGGEH